MQCLANNKCLRKRSHIHVLFLLYHRNQDTSENKRRALDNYARMTGINKGGTGKTYTYGHTALSPPSTRSCLCPGTGSPSSQNSTPASSPSPAPPWLSIPQGLLLPGQGDTEGAAYMELGTCSETWDKWPAHLLPPSWDPRPDSSHVPTDPRAL